MTVLPELFHPESRIGLYTRPCDHDQEMLMTDEMNREEPRAHEEAHEEEIIEETPGGGRKERYRVAGERLLSKVRELIREGNVRRITIKNDEEKTLIEIPLTFGVVGAALFPVWAAVGAIAALVTDCSIEVERMGTEEKG